MRDIDIAIALVVRELCIPKNKSKRETFKCIQRQVRELSDKGVDLGFRWIWWFDYWYSDDLQEWLHDNLEYALVATFDEHLNPEVAKKCDTVKKTWLNSTSLGGEMNDLFVS